MDFVRCLMRLGGLDRLQFGAAYVGGRPILQLWFIKPRDSYSGRAHPIKTLLIKWYLFHYVRQL